LAVCSSSTAIELTSVRGRTNISVMPRLTDEDAAGISEVGAFVVTT
jgi:hypothetical protein